MIGTFFSTQWARVKWFFQKWWGYKVETIFVLVAAAIIATAFIPFTKFLWLYTDKDNAMLWNGYSTRSVIFSLGGVMGAYGVFLAARRLKVSEKHLESVKKQDDISEKNLFSDRFSRAVDSLGQKESLTHKNAGLYLFESLATPLEKDSNDRKIIVNTLHGFIRERAILPEIDEVSEALPPPETQEKRADIVTALEVILRTVPAENRHQVPLSNLDFRQLSFPRFIDLKKVNLRNANMQGADLFMCNLQSAYLADANLQAANFFGANMKTANLRGANLQGANLWGANLQDADLENTDLKGAIFSNSNLQGANLTSTNMKNADLWDANIQGANLLDADLQDARFEKTDISDVDLKGGKNLTQKQLDECVFEEGYSPKNFPEDENGTALTIPKDRHYIWEKNDEGNICRKFKVSGEWIDTFTPRWKRAEEEG